MTDTQTTLDTEHLRALFDMAVNSMNFRSGFLDTDEVERLRAVAVILDVDPLTATPTEFVSQYPHPFKANVYPQYGCQASYGRCKQPPDAPIHQTSATAVHPAIESCVYSHSHTREFCGNAGCRES